MWEILHGIFNENQKIEKMRNDWYNYINTLIDSEILSFITENNNSTYESLNLYAVVNDTWVSMNADLLNIISDFEWENNNYIFSVFKQRMEEYRLKVQNILERTKKS